MQRRDFIKLAGSAFLMAKTPLALATEQPTADWRTFVLTYRVNLMQPGSDAALWLPIPETMGGYQQVSVSRWSCVAEEAGLARISNVPAFAARWRGTSAREATLSVEVATLDRAPDMRQNRTTAAEAEEAASVYLQPTPGMPLDGIVRTTALAATQGAGSPLQKARAVYDWVVDNTFREPKVQGCGRGDIKAMLETGNLGGKCADINSLFVGLCRASGIPAREVYGIRVAESRQFRSLGRAGDVSKAQHCRAEFYLDGAGWIPVDAADVRKAVLEEKLLLDDARIVALRERLFGSWEMNWVAFNHERDIALSPTHRVGFFMYPCAEVAGQPSNSLAPDRFAYSIAAAEAG